MIKEKKNPAIILMVLGLTLFSTLNVLPQKSDSLKTYHVPEVFISASRSERALSDIGRSISLISKKDLDNSIYLMPAEVLSAQEGINIIGTGQTPGSLQNIYMRGTNSNQAVIMVDGLRITDPSSADNAIDLSELSLSNVQRIEIVRGAQSTLYGSSAIGGIINFITEKNMKSGFNADVNLMTGTFSQGASDIAQNLRLNYTAPAGYYFTGEAYNSRTNGMDATVKDETIPAVYKNYDKDNFNKLDLIGKIGYTTSDIDLYASFKKTNQKSDIDAGAFKDDNNYKIDFKRNLFNYGASYKLDSNIKLNFIGGYTSLTRVSVNDSSIVDAAGDYDHSFFRGTYTGTVLNNELQLNYKSGYIDGVIGGGMYTETMNNQTFTYSGGDYGVYIADQDLTPLDIKADIKNAFGYTDINGGIVSPSLALFSLALGGRINHHSTFGDKFTYEINPSLKVTKNSLLYLSYATGFNAPSLYRLFAPDADYTSQITRGNKNLKPEESQSFELGLKHSFGTELALTVSYFNTEVKNNIDYVYLWDKNIPVNELGQDWSRNDYRGDTYLNVGTLYTNGFEFNLSSELTDQLTLTANFSVIHGKLKYSESDIDQTHTEGNHVQIFSNGAFLNGNVEQDNLVRRTNTGNLALNYTPTDDLSFKLAVKYVGKKDDIYYNVNSGPYGALGTLPVSDYTLFDISARYKVLNNLAAIIKIANIFDRNYTEIRGYRTMGRGALLSFQYNLHS